ncbi:hypothetical protein Trydic_g14490 [Trypoxylus dichotomus]
MKASLSERILPPIESTLHRVQDANRLQGGHTVQETHIFLMHSRSRTTHDNDTLRVGRCADSGEPGNVIGDKAAGHGSEAFTSPISSSLPMLESILTVENSFARGARYSVDHLRLCTYAMGDGRWRRGVTP